MTRLALCFVAFAALMLTGCVRKSPPRASVIVVAIDRLGYGLVSCRESAPGSGQQVRLRSRTVASGFSDICNESVRFTHAYATSSLTVPSLTSALTGLYPFESGVRHNGSDSLSGTHRSVAERAQGSGFDTLFISGGPPVFRKSGLHQGFGEFRDHFPTTDRFPIRPAREVVRDLLDWLSSKPQHKPVFAVVYLPDLQLPQRPTSDELGVPREASLESQIHELDRQIATLVEGLKSSGRWETSHLLLFGVTGNSAMSRPGQLPPMNVFSEATHVTLMMKPARKPRDAALSWQIDSNVSLVDLGPTIEELLGLPISSASLPFQNTSLAGLFSHPSPKWPEDRPIVSESAWASWHGLGPIRAATRSGAYFYIHDQEPLIFNTLTDNLEVAPLDIKSERHRFQVKRAQSQLEVVGYVPFAWSSEPAARRVIERLERPDLSTGSLGSELERSWTNLSIEQSVAAASNLFERGLVDMGFCGSISIASNRVDASSVAEPCWSEATQRLFQSLGLIADAEESGGSERVNSSRWEVERQILGWYELNTRLFWVWSMRRGPGDGRDPVYQWIKLPWVRRLARIQGLQI